MLPKQCHMIKEWPTPPPPLPPLSPQNPSTFRKIQGHCASSAYIQSPSIQSGRRWERTDKSGRLRRTHRMERGGRISAILPVISLPHPLHTRCSSKRSPNWRATQSHHLATGATTLSSEMLLLPGIAKPILEHYLNSKHVMILLSTLTIYHNFWKLLDFCPSHFLPKKNTWRKQPKVKGIPFPAHLLLTSRFLMCGL